ncbi:methionyl-tRNA synthetase [Choiromyces venosus 120613-1]|uniref:methionine--tRNA ligase n=1 Tax=Choiromyces venosus 120613-1 TaxID=1336337 RepID=A0A3N4K4R6_9PEZI|nr:methionyl-tRNA synthetase [Choiromyces venosus 120613-1]
MASLKVNIPIPAPSGSPAFTQTLKVCLAASAYGVPAQFVKVSGQTNISLEVPKENKILIEANAIVRYFATIGSRPWSKSGEEALKDFALIEFEESGQGIRAADVANNVVSKANFPTDPTLPPSPAEIILFSTLWDLASTSTSDGKSTLSSWFIRIIGTEWAKIGIEQAATHTSDKPDKPATKSAGKGAGKGAAKNTSALVDDTPREMVQRIKEGTDMKIRDPNESILPVPGERNILITSALPYVNNVPHLGNIIGSVLSADVFSRYAKARNYNTLYICGTDEYGTATETKALEEGVTPRALCDKYNVLHAEIYKWFDIGFDYFGRTTTDAQTEIAQDIFLNLQKNDFLVEESMTQLFCEKHQGFLADRFVEGTCPKCGYEDARGDQCDACGLLLDPFELINPRCKLDGTGPIKRDSKHIFIQLDKLQPEIEEWVNKTSEEGQWSRNGRIITESWLKTGLKPRCITRDLTWGTPVPVLGYEKKVMYVWFDACIGYVSITANYTKEWEKWWKNKDEVKLYQFMGKDNVPFHTVVFPGTKIGTREGNWTMLHHISTTEYLQYEGGKFSKSRGVGVFGNNARDTGVPPSVWRYYLLSSRPETGDTQFVWQDFATKNNSELLANLGNFVNRLIKFVNAKYAGVVPDYTAWTNDPSFDQYKESVNALLKSYVEDLENVRIRAGLEKAMAVSAEGNRFLQDNKLDNALFTNSPGKAAAVVGFGLNLIYLLSALIYPYMPATSESIVKQLNAPPRSIPDVWDVGGLLPGHVIGRAEYLFSRIEEKQVQEWKSRYGGKQEAAVQDTKKGKKKGKSAAKQHAAKKQEEATKPASAEIFTTDVEVRPTV